MVENKLNYKKSCIHVQKAINVVGYALYDDLNIMHKDYMEDGKLII